jgi:predicted Zn-dependent protease
VQWERLVPKWLRLRRKYPNNPVLMRAVAKYLVDAQAGEEARQGMFEEALEEAEDLVKAAPEWYMSHVMYGYILLKAERYDDAYVYFRKAARLNPDHYVGHFNLAFVETKRGKPSEAMRHLRKLVQDPEAAQSYAHVSDDLFDIWKKEFSTLSGSEEFGEEYRRIVETLNAARRASS